MPEPIDYALAEEERRAEKWHDALPKCCRCGWSIEDEMLYDVDGELYCEDCMKDTFLKLTRNYMDW